MSKSVDESQTAQENTPQQAGEKKVKSKQPHQVTNDIKWVPFLIGFHLVTQALNLKCPRFCSVEVSQVLFRLSRWENLEYAKKI